MEKELININDFQKNDIAVGTIIECSINKKSRNPAYVLKIDFGVNYGIKVSSAQLCQNYDITDLINTQIIAVINFPPLKVAGIKSEVLVLAIVCKDNGTVLVKPDKLVANGEKLA